MAPPRIDHSPSARRDLDEIWDYLAREAGVPIADAVAARLFAAMRRAADHPLLYRPRPEFTGAPDRINVSRYAIFYEPLPMARASRCGASFTARATFLDMFARRRCQTKRAGREGSSRQDTQTPAICRRAAVRLQRREQGSRSRADPLAPFRLSVRRAMVRPMARLEPSLFDEVDNAAEKEADARAEADVAAGRVISHGAMKAWLLSWGKPDELPPPEIGD